MFFMLTTTQPHPAPTPTGWLDTLSGTSLATRQRVDATVGAMGEALADLFYAAMFADTQAQQLLDHQLVNKRLHASMARWLRQLFSVNEPLNEVIAVQRHTGEVHARIGVPAHMVARGARALKRAITQQLIGDTGLQGDVAQAVSYVHELIDLAVDAMETAYTSDANRMTRSDEAYRLFFLSQNLKAERERQKLQLLEWAQQILVRYYWEVPAGDAPPAPAQGVGHSQFGMWLQHKASILFDGAPEIANIQQHIETIEGKLLPQLSLARSNHDDARALVGEINLNIERIKAFLATMFDRYSEGEDGRDSVTNLLNRRYLPSVAKREISLAKQQGSGFAMLVIDVDGFKRLRDSLGLEASDLLLQQVGATLIEHLRAGDFVFRIGDDQFLALVVDCTSASLMPLANGLRERMATTRLRTPDHASTLITVSIGVALFDGHPDYQRLLDRATDAMRQAKLEGRNRCVLAG